MKLKEHFEICLDSSDIEYVKYKRRTQEEKPITLKTLTIPTDEFFILLFEKLPVLMRHIFIATQQLTA